MCFESVLDQPRVGSSCPCGEPLALYVVRGEYHHLCAGCTRDRIHGLEGDPTDYPTWVCLLYEEVVYELRSREVVRSWPQRIACSECGRMMPRQAARYPSPRPTEGERRLEQAQQHADGTLLVFPENGIPEILHPTCPGCTLRRSTARKP